MGFPMHVDRISVELPILYFKGSQNFPWDIINYDALLSLNIVFIFANSADPDEMLHYAAFHLGLHCLPKYLFTGIQNEKGPVGQ